MKNRLFLSILVLTAMTLNLFAAPEYKDNRRVKYNFNSDWRLMRGDSQNAQLPSFNDAEWEKVTLPRSHNEDYAFRYDIKELPTGIVWYRKHFMLPESDKGKKVFLEFEGARQAAEVFVNGKYLLLSEDGTMAFGLDITDYLNAGGENIIAVRTNNDYAYREQATGTSYQWNHTSFNPTFGGLHKNIYLYATDKLYQTLPLYHNLGTVGTYIYAKDINIPSRTANINAETEVKNEYDESKTVTLEMVIEDMDGKIIKTVKGSPVTIGAGETATLKVNDKVSGLNFWSWGYGYLYNVYTALYVDGKAIDVVKTRTGFRKTQYGHGMFWLNDRVLQMKGYAQRTTNEWPALGSSVPAWLSDFSNGLIVEGHGNLVRWMHTTPWKQDVESCDRVGLIQAMPAGDSEKDVSGRQWEMRKEVMRAAIIYNKNNPSIIFYECGNEMIGEEHMAEMIAIRDQYDPHGGRAIGSREMLDSKLAEWGGEMLYMNKSDKHPMWGTEYCRDEGLRKFWDNESYPYHKDGEGALDRRAQAPVYDRNMESYSTQMVERWHDYFIIRPGTGRRVSSGGVNIGWADANSHYRGIVNYRSSGEVDAMRIPKDAYYGHKVMWNCWVDIEKHDSFIFGHWNYKAGIKKDVNVVSTGDKVELFLNGKSLGFGERKNSFHFAFPQIAWKAGTLEAVSYDADGKEVSRATKKTIGEPVAITLKATVAPDGFKADGADVALLEFEVVDANGDRHPLDNTVINFEIKGPAEWRGGIAQGENNYILSKALPVECGINRALVRSTTTPGTITITASAEGLKPATITLETKEFKTENGLTTYISGEHQPSYLKRGPTPEGPSFTMKRTDIRVKSAVAGCDSDKVARSYDDNELSEWRNSDDNVENAWITYTLEREAMISEIDVKFSGYRVYNSPISITVGDKEVFRGLTQQTLGFNYYKFEPVKASTVTIKMLGPVTTGNDFFKYIVELKDDPAEKAQPAAQPAQQAPARLVTAQPVRRPQQPGQKQVANPPVTSHQIELDLMRGAGVPDPKAKNQLRIIEIEFFEVPEK